MTDELNFMTARELARRIQGRELSAVEVLRAHLDQIDRVNPAINAIVTLVPERALADACAADAAVPALPSHCGSTPDRYWSGPEPAGPP